MNEKPALTIKELGERLGKGYESIRKALIKTKCERDSRRKKWIIRPETEAKLRKYYNTINISHKSW